jgi:hypothetical protein
MSVLQYTMRSLPLTGHVVVARNHESERAQTSTNVVHVPVQVLQGIWDVAALRMAAHGVIILQEVQNAHMRLSARTAFAPAASEGRTGTILEGTRAAGADLAAPSASGGLAMCAEGPDEHAGTKGVTKVPSGGVVCGSGLDGAVPRNSDGNAAAGQALPLGGAAQASNAGQGTVLGIVTASTLPWLQRLERSMAECVERRSGAVHEDSVARALVGQTKAAAGVRVGSEPLQPPFAYVS